MFGPASLPFHAERRTEGMGQVYRFVGEFPEPSRSSTMVLRAFTCTTFLYTTTV